MLAINLIKKNSRNQIQILNNFYNLYQNENSNIIDLKENDFEKNSPNSKKDINSNERLKKINEENNYIDSLIKILNDKLSNNVKDCKDEKEFDNISLVEKDLISLIPDRFNCTNLLVIKSESGINVEQILAKGLKNKKHKKLNKSDSQSKNIPPFSYSNESYITSNNNTPLTLINIDLKKEKKDEVEKLSNNNKDIIHENIINKVRVIDDINEEKKDSIDADFSLYDDASNFERFIDYFNSDLQ